jgi:hypothetical protein
MTAKPDLEREVRSWLRDDEHEDADRVLFSVLEQIDTTPQRRAGWLARRFPIMNSTRIRYGIAAAAVVVAALVGVRFLSPDVGAPGPSAIPSPEPTATSTPGPLGTQSLAPGRYAVPGFSAGISVAVPAGGWSSNNDWVVIGPRGNEEPDGMAIRFFMASALYEDPSSNRLLEVGPSVDDLVQAILGHPAYEASGPTDVAIDGFAGQMVELSIPADAELTNDQFLIFADEDGGGVWGWAPGQTFELYIVEVNGTRLIIDAFHYPDTPESDLAALRSVVESVQFEAGS